MGEARRVHGSRGKHYAYDLIPSRSADFCSAGRTSEAEFRLPCPRSLACFIIHTLPLSFNHIFLLNTQNNHSRIENSTAPLSFVISAQREWSPRWANLFAFQFQSAEILRVLVYNIVDRDSYRCRTTRNPVKCRSGPATVAGTKPQAATREFGEGAGVG